MKKIIFLILILLIVPLVYAPSKNNVELKVNENFTIGGKTITFLNIANGKILLEIDGSKKIIKSEGKSFADGIDFSIVEIFQDEEPIHTYIKFNVSMDYTCGDKKCEINKEDERICCKDCGCSNNETEACVNNQCVEIECSSDDNCDDNNSCTLDKCRDYVCINELITSCANNDNCCPANCTYSNDNDCPKPPPLPTICEEGEVRDKKYCKNNKWNSQQELGRLCTHNYECLSNICKENKCSENQDPLLPSSERKTVFQKILDFIMSLFS